MKIWFFWGKIFFMLVEVLVAIWLSKRCAISFDSPTYSYFHMCYAWVARFLQDCSKIVSIHSKAIHVYYSFSLIFTCAMHKIVAGVLQDDCNVVVGLLPDCWHKFKYNTKKLDRDCCKIVTRLLQDCCKNVVKSILDPTIFCVKLSIT